MHCQPRLTMIFNFISSDSLAWRENQLKTIISLIIFNGRVACLEKNTDVQPVFNHYKAVT